MAPITCRAIPDHELKPQSFAGGAKVGGFKQGLGKGNIGGKGKLGNPGILGKPGSGDTPPGEGGGRGKFGNGDGNGNGGKGMGKSQVGVLGAPTFPLSSFTSSKFRSCRALQKLQEKFMTKTKITREMNLRAIF